MIRPWEAATTAMLRLALAFRMTFRQSLALWLFADGLLCFLFTILALTAGQPDHLFGLVLCPLYLLGIPILADIVSGERRNGTLVLALASPSPAGFFLVRAAAVAVFLSLQGCLLLAAASSGVHSFQVLPGALYACILTGTTAAIVAAWAVTLRSPAAVVVSACFTIALLSPLTFFVPMFRVERTAWGEAGWAIPWLARVGPLLVVALSSMVLVARRLKMPEPLLTGRRPSRTVPRRRESGAPSVSLRNVSKRFDTRLVIDGVSVTAGAGVVGLLGANGAGKTTLMRMIVGSISPDEGEVVVSGGDGRTAPRIGLLPQDFRVPRGISARAYLEYWAIENGLRRRRRRQEEVERVLDLVGLLEEAGRFIDAFSGGMRQRVGMARALLEDPDILVLDEPSAGMDLIAREGIRSVLAEYGKEHVVLFSTHIASDLEAVAERLLVLDGGKVRFDGSVSRFVESVAGRVWEQRVGAGELAAARRDHRVLSTRAEGDSRVVRALTAPGASLAGGRRCVPNLEDAYLAAIGGMRPALPRSEADLAFLAAVPPPIRRKAAPSP